MGRKKAVEIDSQKVEFVDVDSRRFVDVDIDITEGMQVDFDALIEEVQEALVKIRVTHKAGEESSARRIANDCVEAYGEHAHKVFKPELRAVGERDADREIVVRAAMSPKQAIDAWLKKRSPEHVDSKLVKKEILKRLEGIEVPQAMSAPNRFHVERICDENFMPFRGSNGVALSKGVYGIVGRNRSGKSALLESMLFALYGRGRDVDQINDYVHADAKKMSSVLALATSNGGFEIDRGRLSNSSYVEIGGSRMKVAIADSEVERVVGLSKADFVRTCFVLQGDLHGLMDETSAKIQDDLTRWLGVSFWHEVEKRINADLNDLKKEVERLRTLRAVYEPKIDIVVDQREIAAAKKRIDKLEKVASNVGSVADQIEEAEEAVERAEGLERNRERFDDLKRAPDNLKQIEADISKKVACRDELLMRKSVAERKHEEAQANLVGFDGVCPIDGGDCPRSSEICENEKVLAEKASEALRELRKAEEDVRVASDDLKSLERLQTALRANVRELNAVEARIESMQDAGTVAERKKDLARLKKAAAGKDDPREELEELRSDLSDMLKDQAIREEACVEVEKIDRELLPKVEEDSAVLTYAKHVVGRRGIPSVQIESAAIEIEKMANDVLAKMQVEPRVRFSFLSELGEKAKACSSCGAVFESGARRCSLCGATRGNEVVDKLSVKVVTGGRVQPFKLDSGGGKDLIALAVRIAISKFLGVRVLFLDEVCGSLDDENLRLAVQLISRLTTEEGFDQVFVISHRSEIADALPANIVVEKDSSGEFSTFRLE